VRVSPFGSVVVGRVALPAVPTVTDIGAIAENGFGFWFGAVIFTESDVIWPVTFVVGCFSRRAMVCAHAGSTAVVNHAPRTGVQVPVSIRDS
jgi:hypothetical protein